jgi:hypothetical protein
MAVRLARLKASHKAAQRWAETQMQLLAKKRKVEQEMDRMVQERKDAAKAPAPSRLRQRDHQ